VKQFVPVEQFDPTEQILVFVLTEYFFLVKHFVPGECSGGDCIFFNTEVLGHLNQYLYCTREDCGFYTIAKKNNGN